jgi:uncharacterized protein
MVSRLPGMVRLLTGGTVGAAVMSGVGLPAGALIGAVAGAVVVQALTAVRSRRSGRDNGAALSLPRPLRVVGQIVLGALAGSFLTVQTLVSVGQAAPVLVLYVSVLLASTVALGRVLVTRYGVDPSTAVLAAAPGGISELLVSAQEQGAAMQVVLTIHMFRVLVVVLGVLPVMLSVLAAR